VTGTNGWKGLFFKWRMIWILCLFDLRCSKDDAKIFMNVAIYFENIMAETIFFISIFHQAS
jgi:hypothetical protein